MKQKLTIEEILRRLKSRHDINQDEIETVMGKGEDAIREFYKKTVLKAQKVTGLLDETDSKQDGPIPKDDYVLPDRLKAKVKSTRKAEAKKQNIPDAKKLAQDQKHLPKEERVSQDDIQQALEDLSGQHDV